MNDVNAVKTRRQTTIATLERELAAARLKVAELQVKLSIELMLRANDSVNVALPEPE